MKRTITIEPKEETTSFLLARFYLGQEPSSQISEHYHNLGIEELLSLIPQGLSDMITHIPRARIEHIIFEYNRLFAFWNIPSRNPETPSPLCK